MNESKEHILKTAFKLFLQKSFKEVTMKDIVTETGLSKGAFYHYFKSKEELFLEVLEFFFSEMMQPGFDKYSHNSLKQFIEDYLADTINRLNKAKDMLGEMNANYYFMIFDAIKILPEFRSRIFSAQEYEHAAWEKITGIAREKGEINTKMSDGQIASFFIYSNDGVGIRLILDGNMNELAGELRSLWDGFYNQLKTI